MDPQFFSFFYNFHPSDTLTVLAIACLVLLIPRAYFNSFFLRAHHKFISSAAIPTSPPLSTSDVDHEVTHRPKRQQLPPGSFGLPLIGETLQFAYFSTCPIGTPPPFLSARFQRYGKVFKTHLIGRPTIVSLDPNFNKFLLLGEGRLVRMYLPKFIENIVGPNLILDVNCSRHLQFRHIGHSQLSSIAIQKYHMQSIQEHSRLLLSRWNTNMIDAQEEFKYFTFTYIVKHFINLEPTNPIVKNLIEDFMFLQDGYSSIPLDFPGTKYNKILKVRRRIITTLRQILLEQRDHNGNYSTDFLNMLKNSSDECGKTYSDEDILEFTFNMTFGGFETSSILFTNLMKYLSENQHVVDELRKEHYSIRKSKKDNNELLTWEDYKKMQFTEQVVKETLRMANIAHYLIRETCQDISFEDMLIPKGWMVFLNFAMVHLNPCYFPNPLKFDPWRWLDATNNNPSLLMPFGGGQRSCLGSSFVKFEVSIFIHYLVISYRWERILDNDGQCDVVSSLSLPSMKKGLLLQMHAIS